MVKLKLSVLDMNTENLPTIKEIERQAATDLPEVKLGGYNNIEGYVNTQYTLTRADFVSMVQQGLKQHRADRNEKNPPRNYDLASVNVTFGKQVAEFRNVSWQVCFDPKKVKHIILIE